MRPQTPKAYLIDGAGIKSIMLEQYPDSAWKYLFGGPNSDRERTVEEFRKTIAVMYRGFDLRANGVADMPFKIYRGDEEIDSSETYTNALGFWPSPKRTLKQVELALSVAGRAYLYRLRSRSGVLDLRYFVPTSIDYETDSENGLTGFTRHLATQDRLLAVEDVVYFWPADETVEIGPPETWPALAALNAAGVLGSVDEFVAGFFKRGAIKATLLTVDSVPNKDELAKLESWWKDAVAGIKNAWGSKVVNAGKITPVVVGEGLKELENQVLTQEKKEDIAIALGIPQTILFANAANYATAQVDQRNFLGQTIVPECSFIAEQLNSQLLGPLGYSIEFKPETLEAYQKDEGERSQAYKTYIDAKMKPSIAAQMLGLDLPDGVEYADLDPEEEEPEPEPDEAPVTPEAMQPAEAQPANEPDGLSEAATGDLNKWQRKALKSLERGKGPGVTFESAAIPAGIALYVENNLPACQTEGEVKALFVAAQGRHTSTDKDAALVLEGLRLAVEALKVTQVSREELITIK